MLRKKTNPLIISASRRTDIPAFYSEWFINRIRQGWCFVPNPFNSKQVIRVSLRPDDVLAIVFWSKNPAPLISHLVELDELGLRYYFQFTLNDYPPSLEPRVPSLAKRISTFLDLSEQLGPTRVVWRYDPIIISNITSVEYHRERFSYIAGELKAATRRVMVSIVDFYRKTDRRLSQLEKEEGLSFDRHLSSSAGMISLLNDLAATARENDMEIFTCAEEGDYTEAGIPPGRCVDDRILYKEWSLNLKYKKDPSQRDSCLCMISKDIGINDTCMHGCLYCYATTNYSVAQRRFTDHDPHSPLLWGDPNKATQILNNDEPQMKLI